MGWISVSCGREGGGFRVGGRTWAKRQRWQFFGQEQWRKRLCWEWGFQIGDKASHSGARLRRDLTIGPRRQKSESSLWKGLQMGWPGSQPKVHCSTGKVSWKRTTAQQCCASGKQGLDFIVKIPKVDSPRLRIKGGRVEDDLGSVTNGGLSYIEQK